MTKLFLIVKDGRDASVPPSVDIPFLLSFVNAGGGGGSGDAAASVTAAVLLWSPPPLLSGPIKERRTGMTKRPCHRPNITVSRKT
jgi:hypothetical protein